jgi:hypothetical protein
MSYLEKMNVLLELGDLLKATLCVRLRACACWAENPLLGPAPVRIANVGTEISIAATTDHAAVVERHIVEVEALILDLGVADWTSVGISWDKDSGLCGLISLGLLFQLGVE